MELTWRDVPAADLSTRLLHDVLALRNRVFVVEQACAYQDVDGLDLGEGVRHVVALDGERLVACARVLPGPRIGRVAVAPEARGLQLGRRLMERALAVCEERWPGAPVTVSAQAHLRGFYGSLGFEAVGEEYDEDGIPHVDMVRRAA